MQTRMHGPYKQLFWMGLIHLPFMYAIMFSMVYSWREIFQNLNTLYMAGMMVAPMIVLMPLLMKKMYRDKRLNAAVYASGALLFLVFLLFMRNQAFIGDKQFLKSMIPHHSGAVLMCEKGNLVDPEVKNLCSQIIRSQKNEIERMKSILDRM